MVSIPKWATESTLQCVGQRRRRRPAARRSGSSLLSPWQPASNAQGASYAAAAAAAAAETDKDVDLAHIVQQLERAERECDQLQRAAMRERARQQQAMRAERLNCTELVRADYERRQLEARFNALTCTCVS
jgi:hypothetical protein